MHPRHARDLARGESRDSKDLEDVPLAVDVGGVAKSWRICHDLGQWRPERTQLSGRGRRRRIKGVICLALDIVNPRQLWKLDLHVPRVALEKLELGLTHGLALARVGLGVRGDVELGVRCFALDLLFTPLCCLRAAHRAA